MERPFELKRQVQQLREAAKELDEYLSHETYEKGKPVHLNSVGAYSILHRNLKAALSSFPYPVQQTETH
jgi:hypothetical protein